MRYLGLIYKQTILLSLYFTIRKKSHHALFEII